MATFPGSSPSNSVQWDSTNGVFTVGGIAISGSAPSYTWNTKPAVSAGNINKYIVITDLIETGGVATLFQSDGVATWQQQTIPRTTFAKANASTNLKGTAGLRVLCTDIGLTNRSIELASDGTYLNPVVPQLLFKTRYGTITTPTLTLSATGKFTLSPIPTFQAGMFHDGSEIEIRFKTVRTGAAGSETVTIYLGTAGNNTDSQVAAVVQTTANTQCTSVPKVEFVSTAACIVTGTSTEGGNGTSNVFADRSTQIDAASAMYISAYSTALTAPDTISIQGMSVWWRA